MPYVSRPPPGEKCRLGLIAGLGNPGAAYAGTRHNAGFWFIDILVERMAVELRADSKFHGSVAKVTLGDRDCWLIKPETYMNRSGQAVAAIARYYKIPMEGILVVHDDLDFEPGDVRLKHGGGHGGHNGLRDLISHLGGSDFLRLRIGIGHPGNSQDAVDYVLNRPMAEERAQIQAAIARGLEILPLLAGGDLQKAMHKLHSIEQS